MPHITQLHVYPIKSLRGVAVSSWTVEKRGLKHDRRWMLVDENGEFLTQRKLYRMALFDTVFEDGDIRVAVEGAGSILVPLEPQGPERTVKVWRSVCSALQVSDAVDEWFSNALETPCSLVYMPDSTRRQVSSPEAKSGDLVGFADSNPVLVASEASLDLLNGKLDRAIPITRFRPNIVVNGCGPHEEDEWETISCAGVPMRRTHPCGRCLVTTIDIETAEPSDEPLRTLNAYRKRGNNVYFGCYYVPDAQGEISVGGEMTVRHLAPVSSL